MAAQKKRLDVLMVEQGLAPTRSKAQALIMAGDVSIEGGAIPKAGLLLNPLVQIHVRTGLPYVGRGGFKLAHALTTFQLDPTGLIALDVGACTGGFTDVLLQQNAQRVYAVDVGYGQLNWQLRQDPRVVVLERTNIRHLEVLQAPEGHPEYAQCGVVDVSFISLRLVLPAMQRLLTPTAWIVALIKPQFEAGPSDVGKGGIVRDPRVHKKVLEQVLSAAQTLNLAALDLVASPITGAEGNQEFLACFAPQLSGPAIDTLIDRCISL